MNRITFINKMKILKERSHKTVHNNYDLYLCHHVYDLFDKYEFVEILTSIFNKRDHYRYGIFGLDRINGNCESRLLALEVFETIVLEEKLYRSLV
jgi:hypothetical protein